MEENIKVCPFCESPMMLVENKEICDKPYLECSTCGLRFKTEGFDENPVEIKV